MKNPLNVPQRETAGSSSYEKFDYQYHYALYWLLEKSLENKNIAVFIEYHNSILLILGNNSLRSFVGHSLFKIDCVPFSPFVVI